MTGGDSKSRPEGAMLGSGTPRALLAVDAVVESLPVNPRRTLALAMALSLTLASCGPRLPEQLTFVGQNLTKAAEWKLEGVQSVVFVPEGETIRDSRLQVGILTSTEHKTARELNVWIMRQYRLAKVIRWHESVSVDTACKVGQSRLPFRQFAAVHVCRDGGGMAVCVEADAQLTIALQQATGEGTTDGESICSVQWDAYRGALEALAERVIAQR